MALALAMEPGARLRDVLARVWHRVESDRRKWDQNRYWNSRWDAMHTMVKLAIGWNLAAPCPPFEADLDRLIKMLAEERDADRRTRRYFADLIGLRYVPGHEPSWHDLAPPITRALRQAKGEL